MPNTPTNTAPTILGRCAGDSPEQSDPRAKTEKVGEVSIPFCGGAVGVAHAEIFRSNDREDRGG